MKQSLKLIVLMALALGGAADAVFAAETDCLMRDPSTIVKRGSTYWIYGTGKNVQQFSSPDRLHWTYRGPVFKAAPDWVAADVPANTDSVSWAPDICFFHGTYHLYYCYSTIGRNTSGIGVATNATLDPAQWVDQGLVVRSPGPDSFNALDPCVFLDAAGSPWLSFGSYFSGVKLIALDPITGRRPSPDSSLFTLAEHPQDPINSVEASYISLHQGWYYLFVNWGSCGIGSRSTYNIRVGRSRTVTGPYLDKDGKDMVKGGGTLFLGAVYDNSMGRSPDDEVGPGHAAILHDAGDDWLSTHEEWARDKKGATTINVQKLAWDSDGWPRPVLDPGPYQIVSFLATHDALTTASTGYPLRTQPDHGTAQQQWHLRYYGDGYYALLDSTGKALSAIGSALKPGADVSIVPTRPQDALWLVQQNDDGTYTLFPKSSGKSLALDVSECSPADDIRVGLWTSLGNDCQKWSFRRF